MVGSLHLVGISILCMQCCRYLTEEIFKKPVIVYNYPKEIKAFYMRLNDDKKTVAAMDVLVPKVNLNHLVIKAMLISVCIFHDKGTLAFVVTNELSMC